VTVKIGFIQCTLKCASTNPNEVTFYISTASKNACDENDWNYTQNSDKTETSKRISAILWSFLAS